MNEISNIVVYGALKKIQEILAGIRVSLNDQSREIIWAREDITSVRGADLRRETLQTQIDARLKQIETRLNLRDGKNWEDTIRE